MAANSALRLALGLLALIAMPAAVALLIISDGVVDVVRRRADRIRAAAHEQRTLDRLERAFAPAPPAGPPWASAARVAGETLSSARDVFAQFALERLTAAGLSPAWLPVAPAPAPRARAGSVAVAAELPFEQVVAVLRELRPDRGGPAYDGALRAACRCLALAEHLDEVSGLDLEIERLRVEGALGAAGVSI